MSKDPHHTPVAVRSPRGARVTEIDWADGHRGIYPHAVLRGYCPCAGCQGHSGEVRFVETTDMQQELDDIEPVGGYALSLKWFDGHASGIYSFHFLRTLCRCEACGEPPRSSVADADRRP
ncbi:MAG: DUF971 domain-containing protein [Myxococcota bacterium]|nr:DUF971 domain-containing protein [Myxococcota bacterium]